MRLALLPALILLALSPLAQAQAPAAAAPAADANKPLAVVNGKEIPALYGDLIKREMAQGQPDSPQLNERVRQFMHAGHKPSLEKGAAPPLRKERHAPSHARWIHKPQAVRDAFIASLIFSPPPSLDQR